MNVEHRFYGGSEERPVKTMSQLGLGGRAIVLKDKEVVVSHLNADVSESGRLSSRNAEPLCPMAAFVGVARYQRVSCTVCILLRLIFLFILTKGPIVPRDEHGAPLIAGTDQAAKHDPGSPKPVKRKRFPGLVDITKPSLEERIHREARKVKNRVNPLEQAIRQAAQDQKL
jgi:hypothetical protein